ncbi:MAG: hypothetical protein ACREMT_08840, partial [Vulcanimicrobiaceae bacterium]
MSPSVSLASIADLADSIRRAHSVELDAYVLRNPLIVYSLESAARAGAHVTVRLGDPGRAPERDANLTAMRELAAAGADVVAQPGFGPHASHAKIAVIDNAVYLDDRNFTGDESETIVLERPKIADRTYEQTKSAALAGEATMIRESSGHDVILATESLGPGPVVDALCERARRGDDVRVMYNHQTQDRET